MNQRDGEFGFGGTRFHWGGYGFLVGILVGVLMGWMFNGFVGAFVRLAMAAMVVVPVILLYIAWRRYVAPWLRPRPAPRQEVLTNAIETRAVVHGVAHEPIVR